MAEYTQQNIDRDPLVQEEKTKMTEIQITRKHITKARTRLSLNSCPITLALQETFPGCHIVVDYDWIYIEGGSKAETARPERYEPSDEIMRWIHDYDCKDQPPHPVTIQLWRDSRGKGQARIAPDDRQQTACESAGICPSL